MQGFTVKEHHNSAQRGMSLGGKYTASIRVSAILLFKNLLNPADLIGIHCFLSGAEIERVFNHFPARPNQFYFTLLKLIPT